MAYNPATDFLGLVRSSSDGAEFERMPGLDYVVAALARAGLFSTFVGQTAPTANQQNTVWIKPAVPSWTAECTVFLWDVTQQTYVPATLALWRALLAPAGYSFQSLATASGAALIGTSVLAVQRNAPAATGLVLPSLSGQFLSGRSLEIVDWSTNITNHVITLTTPDGSTIMRQTSWQLLSSAVQLAGVKLKPVPDLNGWIIAP